MKLSSDLLMVPPQHRPQGQGDGGQDGIGRCSSEPLAIGHLARRSLPGGSGAGQPRSPAPSSGRLSVRRDAAEHRTSHEVLSVTSLSPPVQTPSDSDDESPPAPVDRDQAAVRRELELCLFELPFSDAALLDREAQEAMEDEYLDRAANVALRREKAFGMVQPYRVGQRTDMSTQTRAALLPMMFEALRSFVSSAFRSPSGSASSLGVIANKDFFPVDHALTTAAVQGAAAYMAEGTLDAMARKARLSNLESLAKNRFDDLFYQHGVQHGTVLLQVVHEEVRDRDGQVQRLRKKQYVRAGELDAPLPARLDEELAHQLEAIHARQTLLQGNGVAFLFNPLVSGGLNALRRWRSSDAVLNHPAPLFLTSALASGAASGLTQLGLDLGKTRAQVEIDDLVGGHRKVNLFRLERPEPDLPPLQWSDIGGASLRGLRRFAADTAREAVDIAGSAMRTPLASAWDMLSRYALSNAAANIAGMGAGLLGGQVMRPGRALGPVPGESPRSRAAVFQQLVQSTFGDATWRAMKVIFRQRELNAAKALDKRRKRRIEELRHQALALQRELRQEVQRMRPGASLWAGQPDVEAAGSLREHLLADLPLELPALRGLKERLLSLCPVDEEARADLAVVKGLVQDFTDLLEERERRLARLQPRGRTRAGEATS